MPSFEQAWTAVAKPRDAEAVSPKLRPLLQATYVQVLAKPLDLFRFVRSLEELLEFLAGDGRTNANCWAADLFFSNCEGWEGDWGEVDLPENLHDVLAAMGEALHDTVKDPDVAKNFGCLPEQLLAVIRNSPAIAAGAKPSGSKGS